VIFDNSKAIVSFASGVFRALSKRSEVEERRETLAPDVSVSLMALRLSRTAPVDEVLADLVGKLNYLDEVPYTKTEAHRDIKQNSIISTLEGRL
jgi:hypothetical protein